jgi:hypothetical protein
MQYISSRWRGAVRKRRWVDGWVKRRKSRKIHRRSSWHLHSFRPCTRQTSLQTDAMARRSQCEVSRSHRTFSEDIDRPRIVTTTTYECAARSMENRKRKQLNRIQDQGKRGGSTKMKTLMVTNCQVITVSYLDGRINPAVHVTANVIGLYFF